MTPDLQTLFRKALASANLTTPEVKSMIQWAERLANKKEYANAYWVIRSYTLGWNEGMMKRREELDLIHPLEQELQNAIRPSGIPRTSPPQKPELSPQKRVLIQLLGGILACAGLVFISWSEPLNRIIEACGIVMALNVVLCLLLWKWSRN